MRYLFLLLPLLIFGQTKESQANAIEEANLIFERDLIKAFINPKQLDEKNTAICQQYIQDIISRYKEPIVSVRFERAFKNSEATYVFTPIFVLENNKEVRAASFRIMQ
jgi:hypothetical protein